MAAVEGMFKCDFCREMYAGKPTRTIGTTAYGATDHPAVDEACYSCVNSFERWRQERAKNGVNLFDTPAGICCKVCRHRFEECECDE